MACRAETYLQLHCWARPQSRMQPLQYRPCGILNVRPVRRVHWLLYIGRQLDISTVMCIASLHHPFPKTRYRLALTKKDLHEPPHLRLMCVLGCSCPSPTVIHDIHAGNLGLEDGRRSGQRWLFHDGTNLDRLVRGGKRNQRSSKSARHPAS
jgi:hypothetical protein